MKSNVSVAARLAMLSMLMSSLLVGCGGSTTPEVVDTTPTTLAPLETPLTVGDATVLSRLLFNNYDKGGADVSVKVPYGLQSSIEIEGVVDWKAHVGKAEVRVIGADGAIVDSSTVYWRDLYDPQKGLVATTLKGLKEALVADGRVGATYIARPFSENSPLDRVLRYLDGLATVQAENPLLLRQDEKAKSVGVQTITGVAGSTVEATALRYGKSTYWADAKSGLMVQASAPLAGLPEETLFSFSGHGPRPVTMPAAAEVVDAADIPQIYESLTKRNPTK